ncbi:hypothetical protein J6590_007993 [Homalodisca vitripennis]|nr:hypothetical protein J6590_007993 [Homalodisca vitripennis]
MNQEEIREWSAADYSESEFIDMVLHPDNLSVPDTEDNAADDRQYNTANEIFHA